MKNNLVIKSFKSKNRLYNYALSFVEEALSIKVDNASKFVVFPGGKTPEEFYKVLQTQDHDWSGVNIILTDERLVSVKDINSNFKTLHKFFIDNRSKEFIPDLMPDMSTYEPGYEEKILENLNKKFKDFPEISLSFLGVGEDGHTASIFPDLNPISNSEAPFFLTKRRHEDFLRISVSEKFILKSKQIVLLILGNKKREILKKLGTNDLSLPINRIINNSKNKILCITDIKI